MKVDLEELKRLQEIIFEGCGYCLLSPEDRDEVVAKLEADQAEISALTKRNKELYDALMEFRNSTLTRKLEAAQRFINHVEGEVACFLGSGDDGVIGDENVLRAVTIMHKRKIAADNFYRRIKEIYDSGNVGKLEDALAAFDKETE